MGHRPSSLRVLVLHNNDYRQPRPDSAALASLADVESAARGVATALARARPPRRDRRRRRRPRSPSSSRASPRTAPDLVFNLCESLRGDSRHEVVVPSLLELAGVPYTGSGPLALGLALRKDRTKEILRARGVPTPEAVTSGARAERRPTRAAALPADRQADARGRLGRHRQRLGGARSRRARRARWREVVAELRQPALVERFIDGRELYVSLLGNAPPEALPFHEIDFSTLPRGLPRIVSYAGKWDTELGGVRSARARRAASSTRTARLRVVRAARAAFDALGLSRLRPRRRAPRRRRHALRHRRQPQLRSHRRRRLQPRRRLRRPRLPGAGRARLPGSRSSATPTSTHMRPPSAPG